MAAARHKVVPEIRCTSALQFLEVLDPIAGPFQHEAYGGNFLFRGVSSRRFKLLPTAFRSGILLPDAGENIASPCEYASDQCAAELNALRRFFDIAAREGIRLPEDSQYLRELLDEWHWKLSFGNRRFQPFIWPPSSLFALIGLAQHYGIPTRALDWTRSSMTAAYFAARGAIATPAGRICVWVFNDIARQLQDFSEPEPLRSPLIVFSAPGADNANLRAQRGVFMLFRQAVTANLEPFKPHTYDVLLRELYSVVEGGRALFKVTLPATQAATVLGMLAIAGISAGSLFPGLWGVAREYEEITLLHARKVTLPRREHLTTVETRLLKRSAPPLDGRF